jgi:uncharacterized protein (TIGR02246 family)
MEARTPEEWAPLFQKAMREGDLEAVLSLYEPGAAFANRAGRVRVGHEQLREEFGPLAEVRSNIAFTPTKIIQSGDIALIHNEAAITSPQNGSGHPIEVLRRQPDGRWLLVIGDPFTIGQG